MVISSRTLNLEPPTPDASPPTTMPIQPKHLTLPLTALAIALTLAGCGAGPADSGRAAFEVVVDTVGGVERVLNRGEPATWSLREVLTLGRVGGEEGAADEFGRIVGLLADEDGRIYVADAMATEIRVFDGSGSLVRRLGREGAGPGEAYTPFWRVGEAGGELVFVRQTPAGPADILPSPPAAETQSLRVRCILAGGQGISVYGADFAPLLLRVPAPGVVNALAWTAEYRIALVTAQGDTVRVVERDLPPMPVPDDLWREEVAKFAEYLDGLPDPRCEPARLPRPEAMARLRAITFDADGRLWVERRTASGGFALDAFDTDGRLLGTVPIPDRLERVPPYIRDGRLYLVVTDEFEVEYVKVFEIDGAAFEIGGV